MKARRFLQNGKNAARKADMIWATWHELRIDKKRPLHV
jgi:hypothetical protein